MKGFILQDKAAEMILLRCRFAKFPPPVQQSRAIQMKMKGLPPFIASCTFARCFFNSLRGAHACAPPPKYIRKSYGIFCSRFYERSPRVRVVLCLTKRERRHAVRKLLCNPYCSLRVRHAEFQAFAPPAPHGLLGLRNGMRCRSGRCPLLLYACLPRDYSIVIRFSSNLT